MQDNHSGDKRSPNNREGPVVPLRAERIGLQCTTGKEADDVWHM